MFAGLDAGNLRARFAPNGEKLLIHISNFRPVKRVQDVVSIFLKVAAQLPCKLILAGEGPELAGAVQAITDGGQEHNLILLGNRERVEEIINACDVLLLPSQTESFGLVALEAMGCGIPVVASNAGGLPEVVENDETGFLLPVGDTDGMTERTIQLLQDRTLYDRISSKAKQTALSKFRLEGALNQYEAMYEDALAV
jgi:N-acetyl-alpha-D-glucosaminyl L-malate synthase BshA